MWRTQLRMGLVPYYMFVERDTGPQGYFAVPLARAVEIFRDAYASVSGLCRTVRGPSMSATPGKVCVDGVAEIAGQRVFVLHMIQARDPSLVGRPFFAHYRPGRGLALRPAAGVRRQVPVRVGASARSQRRTGAPSCSPRPAEAASAAPGVSYPAAVAVGSLISAVAPAVAAAAAA